MSFFSGATDLFGKLKALPGIEPYMVPGLSCASVFFSRLGFSMQDAVILSTHGISRDIWKKKLLSGLGEGKDIFFITSGSEDVREIGRVLISSTDMIKTGDKIEIYWEK